MEGALPALQRFKIFTVFTPDVLSKLAQVLKGGALPNLEHVEMWQCHVYTKELDLLSDMVKARAQIPECKTNLTFEGGHNWLGHASPATRTRLLRTLLPSLKELPRLEWNLAYEACFHDLRPPNLEALRIEVLNAAGLYPSCEMLETIPSLKTIHYLFNGYQNTLGAAPFQSVITALQRGVGLKVLQEVELYYCKLGDVKAREFLLALQGSGCADRMAVLSFDNCGIYDEGARPLAGLLRRDGLLALEKFSLSSSCGIFAGGWWR